MSFVLYKYSKKTENFYVLAYSTVDATVSCFISLNIYNVITDGWVFSSLAHLFMERLTLGIM